LVYPEGERIAKGDSFEARSVENFFPVKHGQTYLCAISLKNMKEIQQLVFHL
jgi:hypothetical protein